MDYWFGPHIDTEHIKTIPTLTDESNFRYALEIPFKERSIDGPSAYIVMKNPSQAGRKKFGRMQSDKTVYKVCHYFYVRKYSKVIILNLAGMYATYISEVDHNSFLDIVAPTTDIHANDKVIKRVLKKFRPGTDLIAVGWGGFNNINGSKRVYDNRISKVVQILQQYSKELYMHPCDGNYPYHPAHDTSWHDWEELVLYQPKRLS